MLNTSELSRITKELMLGLPPTLTTPEAMEAREAIAKDLAQMRKDGIAPDLPYDFDELPPLAPSAPPPTEEQMQASKLNLIRHNLASSYDAGMRMLAEDDELHEAQAQCCLTLEARIEAQPSWSPSEREAFLSEIATLTQQGKISPYHARRATWVLRLATGEAPPRRPRRKPRKKP